MCVYYYIHTFTHKYIGMTLKENHVISRHLCIETVLPRSCLSAKIVNMMPICYCNIRLCTYASIPL